MIPDGYLELGEDRARRILAERPFVIDGASVRGLTLADRFRRAGFTPSPRGETIIVARAGAADAARRHWERGRRRVYFFEGGGSPFHLGYADPTRVTPCRSPRLPAARVVSIDFDYARGWPRYRAVLRCPGCGADLSLVLRMTLFTELCVRCPDDQTRVRVDPVRLLRAWKRRARRGSESRIARRKARWEASRDPLAWSYAPIVTVFLEYAEAAP